MSKIIVDDHRKSGAKALYNGAKTEDEQRLFLAEKRAKHYSKLLIDEVARKFHMIYYDLEAASFVSNTLKYTLKINLEISDEASDKIVIISNFDTVFPENNAAKGYNSDRAFSQSFSVWKLDTVSLNRFHFEEMELYELIMQYRKSHGLPRIPISQSLTIVAKLHVRDLQENAPYKAPCNMHTWSSSKPKLWQGCCYTEDHRYAECIWDKPRELTNYKGNGYEIAFGGSSGYVATPDDALSGWKGSFKHNEVMINRGVWKNIKWNAIGIGMYRGYAVVWFGEEADVHNYDGIVEEIGFR